MPGVEFERTATRLWVDADLTEGAMVEIGRERAHFLRDVLRLAPGTLVSLFNGRDGEWIARIETLAKSEAVLRPERRTRSQTPSPNLWLLFAPIKGGRVDSVAEKATELGVSVLWPILTRRTEARRVNLDRLRANAIEAAEQCERLDVPEVREPIELDRLPADLGNGHVLFVCAEAGGAIPIAEAVQASAGRPVAFLVGPEGGFAPEEFAWLRRRPDVVPVGLGPRVLRADTATFAALSCFQAVAGDWTRSGLDNRPRDH